MEFGLLVQIQAKLTRILTIYMAQGDFHDPFFLGGEGRKCTLHARKYSISLVIGPQHCSFPYSLLFLLSLPLFFLTYCISPPLLPIHCHPFMNLPKVIHSLTNQLLFSIFFL